jgi:DNA-binding NarL/FixJ family response regulator
MKRKVLVVDDHPIVREGLTQMINREPDLSVCGDAANMQKAAQLIDILRPDILIIDISLNGPDGLDLLKHIRTQDPSLPVLILSMHDESIYAERALRAGANGYIMKQEATDNVLDALRRILNREIYVSPRIANKMLQQFVGVTGADKKHSSVDELSDRELEVFRLIGAGHGTRQIAEELHLSVKTVETYQAHLKEKLVLRNSRELVQYAARWTIGR